MKDHFAMFAAYNSWANNLVYEAAAALSEEELHRSTGAFFGSLMATLNHLMVADNVWMYRFTGEGFMPSALGETLHTDFAGLRQARQAMDERIVRFVDGLTEERIAGTFTYSAIGKPDRITQRLGGALAHFFNHQTHHRGQCHATLTGLGKPSLTLDLVYFQRAAGQQWL